MRWAERADEFDDWLRLREKLDRRTFAADLFGGVDILTEPTLCRRMDAATASSSSYTGERPCAWLCWPSRAPRSRGRNARK